MLNPALIKLAHGWDANALKAALLEDLDAVPALLAGEGPHAARPWETNWQKRHTLDALATFPVNDATLGILTKLALSNVKEQRQAAYAAFSTVPRASVPIHVFIEALSSGSKDTRVAAVEWLGKLYAKEAGKALSDAFKKEKVDALRASIVRVLVGFGEPIDSFLDRAALAKDAEKALKKGVPEALAFMSIETLPEVHWKDGSKLDLRVLTSWILGAHKSKSPIASPLIVAYAGELHEAEREALGRAVYERWSEEDFALHDLTLSQEERVIEFAERKKLPFEQARYAPDFKLYTMGYGGGDENHSIAQGALDHRGVLALASALAPRFLVPQCVRYVKLYRGLRIGQSRAMIHMLAGMETAAATQALVALSLRFRTASLRKEAEKMVNDLAARRGWTPDELADRTMPTAGLDEDGLLHLEFIKPRTEEGDEDEEPDREVTRRFVGQLDANLELVVLAIGDDGSKALVAKLPEPRKDEDAKQAGEEKKRLAASKKELKALVAAQRARLYAAMCSERTWTADEFASIYLAHPVMKHVATRLLVRVTRVDGTQEIARPTEDGSYVNSVDNTVEIEATATLQLAHSTHLSAEEEARWGQHLADYEVIAFFAQLGRKPFALDATNAQETRIASEHTLHREVNQQTAEFAKRIHSLKLRGLATRLGFDREATGDGGYVRGYEQRLPALGMTMCIVHSPVQLGDEKQDVTLEGVEFVRGEQHAPTPLGQVPKVLLNEGWNVLLAIMA